MDRGRQRLESRLCEAVKDGDPRSVEMLLSQGASASVVGSRGVAALHLAVGKETEKSVRCLKLLLQHRADPNVRSSEGLTPLHVAALWGCYQNVRLLLANGGDPNVTDQDGNTPGQLAEQQDNHKCARLLQNHQAQSAAQLEDRPLSQHSLYSDQTDISSYPDSDCSLSSRVSMISDCGGEDPLSSTRHSALFDRPTGRPHPWWRGGAPLNGHAHVHPGGGGGLDRDWDKHADWLADDGPSFLCSTRVSAVGCASAGPLHHHEDVTPGDTAWAPRPPEGPSLLSSTRVSAVEPALLSSTRVSSVEPALLSSTRVSSVEPVLLDGPGAEHNIAATVPGVSSRPPGLECRPSVLDRDAAATTAAAAGPSRRASRKSVSFRGVDEYFPVFFRPESPRTPVVAAPLDSSEGLDFGSSERMVTVLHRQGIDVTSPDHVHVFDWDSSLNTEGDMEKTVVSDFRPNGGDETDTEEEEEVGGGQTRSPEQPRLPQQPHGGVAGSDSSGSHYSSCDSDHYNTAHYTTAQAGLVPAGRSSSSSSEEAARAEAPRWDARHPTDVAPRSPDVGVPAPDRWEDVAARVGGLTLCDRPSATDSAPEPRRDLFAEMAVDPPNEAEDDDDVVGEVGPVGRSARGSREDPDRPFTPSPFVTGRTRSRLSRCSARIGSTQDSLSSSSSVTSLFEETLPGPVRSHRKAPRSQGSDDVFHSPHARAGAADAGPTGAADETHSSSELSDSQADTFILPRGGAERGPPSPTLPDTIILERTPDSPTRPRQEDLAPERAGSGWEDFLTDDRTSSDQAEPRWTLRYGVVGTGRPGAKWHNEGPWITAGSDAAAEPEPEPEPSSSSSSLGSTSSSSCYFTPRRSRRDSSETASCTPGTNGCTPRYSMSRLSLGVRRPRSHGAPQDPPLARTPGGRPAAPDPDPEEPVEYLYTDTEQGHELIETRIPPTANASVSSGGSDPAADETVLYDWRSLRADVMRGKENQTPQYRVEEEEEVAAQLQRRTTTKKQQQQKKEVEVEKRQVEAEGGSALPDTRGMTDRELRRRLLDLGESPGPISARTRPVYVRRLCRLIQESAGSPGQQRQEPDQLHADSGYSLELSRALRTFDLPDCHAAELELCQQFDQPDQNKKWREGVIKSSFNYLLLDPRVTKNLPSRSRAMSPHECFQTFVHAVFYVGKGKRARPYSHLYEALEYFRGDKTAKKLCSKVQHILQVWGGGQGVISLHCFQNVIPVEAFTREACMVDCIGLKMLTNKKRGDYYGVVSTWQARKRRELGVHLLYRAMQIFLAEGERQLRPADIRQ